MSEVEILSPRSRPLHYGDVIPGWCSVCKSPTNHVYGWHNGHWVVCLECFPEAKEEVKNE